MLRNWKHHFYDLGDGRNDAFQREKSVEMVEILIFFILFIHFRAILKPF